MTVNVDPLCPQQHTHPKHNPNRCIFCEYGAAVRAAALDATRDAVAALPRFDEYGYGLVVHPDGDFLDRAATLAAIDALREEHK